MRTIVTNIISLLAILLPNLAYAECIFYSGEYKEDSVDLGNTVVQRDTPAGTVLTAYYLLFPEVSAYCDNGTNGLFDTGIFSKTTSLPGVYETNVPGIGIRVTTEFGTIRMEHLTPLGLRQSMSTGVVELVKMEEKAQSGILNNGMIMSWAVGDGPGSAYTLPMGKWNLVNGSITVLACAIQSGNSLAFPIGDVQADQFTQLGTHSQQTSTANLKLDCDADANINVTLAGTQNPDTADDSVLELSNQGDDKVASGIGVQLLYNDTPLELNKMLNLKRSAGDQESFPITARYIQTKDKVRAGQANATATLNLTYQ
ncbi:hypothetical protein XU19_04630 [Vibrio parahaemolyticus]|nr:hypothetical protein XU19_04630 [Vibrio parahaemolyticus]KOP95708.1 hypothetical protein AL012_10290 [Citrobacter amalonaticus]KKY40843.1 hypothetical protein AAY51_20245 [Vibrio parahaemolyticus]KOP99945.1 hypothetical protein ALC61_01145 [Citrobacter amalonaticus]OUE56935.1 hypothetical protein AZ012_001169 [Citrobacter amalonaticus]